MMSQIIRMIRIIAVFPLVGLSLFIYKLALQPAIHQFYLREPNMHMVYGLVLVAAFVHAVLLSSVVLKFYRLSLHLVSSVMALAVLVYCVQLAWMSPLEHSVFWLVVFCSYGLMWGAVLWFGIWFVQREQAFEMQAHTHTVDDYSLHAKNRHG